MEGRSVHLPENDYLLSRGLKLCRASQESNLESSDPKSDALSIAPLALHGMHCGHVNDMRKCIDGY